jgi:DNA polymerase-4
MTLRYLFVDMNAYFASVEQQLRPELRGKPVGVVPMLTNNTCCLAASYEAKKFGIKTGTRVSDAYRICPGIRLVEARVPQYVEFHHQIVEAVDSVIPVEQVFSIDEMSCQLEGAERNPAQAAQISQQIKRAIAKKVGSFVKCSVGIGPNRFLAKVATDLQKPDGQTILEIKDLREKLRHLQLNDLPGIGSRMNIRLHQMGISTIDELYAQSKSSLHKIWGGIVGERWWHLLRGDVVDEQSTHRRTVGQSHVLPPEFRTPEKARGVMIKLLDKAAIRLRRMKYYANRLEILVTMLGEGGWRRVLKLGHVQDTQTLLAIATQAWDQGLTEGRPLKVAVTLFDLTAESCLARSLFPEEQTCSKLAHIVDQVNQRYGSNCIYYAAMSEAMETAPVRIPFGAIPEREDIKRHYTNRQPYLQNAAESR